MLRDYNVPVKGGPRQSKEAGAPSPGVPAGEAREKPAEERPENAVTGGGRADVHPVQVKSGSAGNTMNVIYHVGEDSPSFRMLKITVPQGWSVPSENEKDDGYFSVEVRGGKLVSRKTEGMSIILELYGLTSGKGEAVVKYGDKTKGGRGARVSQ